MIRSLWRWGALLVLLATLPALACNLVSGDTLPSLTAREDQEEAVSSGEEPSVEATTTPANGDSAPAAEAGPAFPDVRSLDEALAQFNSYRIQVHMQFQDGADSSRSGTMTMNTARVLQPPATSVEMQVSGSFAEESEGLAEGLTLSFVEVDGSSYSIVPGVGCVPGVGGAELLSQINSGLDADELINEINDPEYIGEEIVNGVATHHYRFDESSFGDSQGQLSDARGNVYISQEHQYVVRMVVDGVGNVDAQDSAQSQGAIHFEMNVLDVGEPITIAAPPECEATASEYPIMEGASDVATFAGLTTYSVTAPLQDVVTFYQEEMAARGYQQSEDSFFTESTALITFNAEGLPAVTVTLGADGQNVAVLITAEQD